MSTKIDDIYVKIGGDSKGLTAEVVKTDSVLSAFDKSVEDLNRSTKSVSASTDTLKRKTRRLGEGFRRESKNVDKFRRSVRGAAQSMKSFGSAGISRVTLPLALLGAASTRSAATLEESFIKINTLVGISQKVINGYKKDIEGLSDITSKPQEELAEALFVVTSAGLRGAEAMDVLTASAKSGVIGLGETKVIAKAVTAAMQAYGSDVLSAAKATDILTAIVREGNLEASELAPVLGRVIGIASQLGVSFQEVGANIATFTRLGVDSAEAVTGLRGILSVLLKPSAAAADALAKVGLSAQNLRKQVREEGLAKTMNSLITAFKGNDEALSAVIPNVRALAAALGTSGAQAEKYEEVLLSIQNSTGLVDKGFAKASKGSMIQFRKSLNDLKNASIDLGKEIIPFATKLAKKISFLASAFRGLDKNTKLLIAAGIGLTAMLPPIIALFASLAIAVNAATWPIIAVTAAVIALGTSAVYVYKNWEAFKDRFQNLWQNIAIVAIEHIRYIVKFFTMGANLIIKGLNAIGVIEFNPFENLDTAFDNIIEKLNSTKQYSEREFQSFGEFMGSVADDLKNKLRELSGGFGGLTDGVDKVTNASIKRNVSVEDNVMNDVTSGVVFPDGYINKKRIQVSKDLSNYTKTISDHSANLRAEMQSLVSGLNQVVQSGLVNVAIGIGGIIEGMISGASKSGDALKLLLTPFADMMIQAGTMMVAFGIKSAEFFTTILSNPFAAIAAGVGLIAVGSAFKGALSGGSSGGASTSSSGGFSGGGGSGGVLSANISWDGIEFYLDERGKLRKRN